jgi:hypothetical protein
MTGRPLKPCKDASRLPANIRRVSLARDCVNVDQLVHYKRLEHVECELRKDWLKHLAELPQLGWIELTLPKSDRIASIESLAQVHSVVVRCNRHQTNLNFLRGLDSVRSLCVSEALGVTQLTPIGKLSGLQELYVDGSMGRRHKVRSFAPLAKLSDLRFAVLLVGSEQLNRPLRHLVAMRKLEYLYLDASFRKNANELNEVVEKLPRLSKIEFNGGMTWPRRS